jgi:hypothetical protein
MVLLSMEQMVEEADSLPLQVQTCERPAVLQDLSLLSVRMM